MENAVDALKMAAAVLIFVIAIGSSFSLFGTAKSTADSIITMRDKQSYLEAAELDNGILYTSSSKIKENYNDENKVKESDIQGVTTKGDRIVKVEDVISTIYRYSKEKYGVTIMKIDGNIIARYDSNTDQIMSLWNSVKNKNDYTEKLNENTKTAYIINNPKFNTNKLEELYNIEIIGGSSKQKCGAPWYGNDEQIRKRISCDLNGKTYEYNNQKHKGESIKLLEKLEEADTIVEVINEIDNSIYLKDKDKDGTDKTTDLLQQYEMPTIEVVYIIN